MNSPELKFLDKNKKETVVRYKKLDILRKSGFSFPSNFRCNITLNEIYKKYNSICNTELQDKNLSVSIAGRVVIKRIVGKASFLVLQDIENKIQLYLNQDRLSEEIYKSFIKIVDLGDIIGACGSLFRTKTGELSIYCKKLYLLTKSLQSLPSKFYGLSNQEIKYRQRYLDLIVNEQSRNIFRMRSTIIMAIRNFLLKMNFIEVETPMMQFIPDGASARPFVTYHNELESNLYLRIAPELYLKKLLVGGFNKVFEINRSFRNEGLSPYHNPEFTTVELYMAYSDYEDLIKLTEDLLFNLAKNIIGTTKITYKNYLLNFNKPFNRLTMREAILKKNYSVIRSNDLDNVDKVVNLANKLKLTIHNHWKIGRIIAEIFDKTIKPNLIQPTFITEYPIDISPLARRSDKDSKFTDRFELFISGIEIGNGFSELNDVQDQKERFYNQIYNKIKVNNKEFNYDKDYILALEYGLPPSAGLGIGIDRLIMLLTNSNNIRDVILFPMLKSRNI